MTAEQAQRIIELLGNIKDLLWMLYWTAVLAGAFYYAGEPPFLTKHFRGRR
jgi:hypothetical protein